MVIIQYITVVGNKSVGPCRDTEEEAKLDASSNIDVKVISVYDYILQLESAIASIEAQYTAQKIHMKQLWKDTPPGQAR